MIKIFKLKCVFSLDRDDSSTLTKQELKFIGMYQIQAWF